MKTRNNAVGPQVREGKKNARKDRPAQVVAGASILGGLQVGTQYFAHSLHYHQILGWSVGKIYPAWGILEWALKWQGVYPQPLIQAGGVGVAVTAGGLLVAAGMQHFAATKPQANEYMHGSARWADRGDIEQAGLLPRERTLFEKITLQKAPLPNNGVYVGGWVDDAGTFHYLRHAGPEHVMTLAPTRSGKGVGLVIPTMLSWTESIVATDLKGELKALTAGWRQKYANNYTIFFEPASSTDSAKWNPLHEVRVGSDYEVADCQNIATLLADPDGRGFREHWDRIAFGAFTGLIVHVIYRELAARKAGIPERDVPLATMASLDQFLSDPTKSLTDLWAEMMEATYYLNPKTGEYGPHPVVAQTGKDMADTPEEELGSKLSTIKGFLALYRDPVIQKNTETCDYKIRDLMHGDKPVSLYIITQPADKMRLRPLVKLKLNMIMRILTEKMEFEKGRPKANYNHRLLFMLDEFAALGKMQIIQESLAFCAGYGIKCYLILQNRSQLTSREDGYGPDETISGNCHIKNAYPPNEESSAEYLSKMVGVTTIVKESLTESGSKMAPWLQQVSRTMTETSRPLLTPNECQTMPGPLKDKDGAGDIIEAGDMLIMAAGFPSIYGKQPLYFKDPIFQARAEVPAPEKSDVIVPRVADGDRPAVTGVILDGDQIEEQPAATASELQEEKTTVGEGAAVKGVEDAAQAVTRATSAAKEMVDWFSSLAQSVGSATIEKEQKERAEKEAEDFDGVPQHDD